jgi:hypothetical protein
MAVCEHAPAPLQVPTGVIVPLPQLGAAPQMVLESGNWQVFSLPLHEARQGPVPVQAVRAGRLPVRGAPPMVVQVPSEPASLHDPH